MSEILRLQQNTIQQQTFVHEPVGQFNKAKTIISKFNNKKFNQNSEFKAPIKFLTSKMMHVYLLNIIILHYGHFRDRFQSSKIFLRDQFSNLSFFSYYPKSTFFDLTYQNTIKLQNENQSVSKFHEHFNENHSFSILKILKSTPAHLQRLKTIVAARTYDERKII